MTYTEFLLEEIAANTRGLLVEKQAYLESLREAYASSQQSTATVHGDLRTQPATRERDVPVNVERKDARVRGNIDPRLTQKKTIIG